MKAASEDLTNAWHAAASTIYRQQAQPGGPQGGNGDGPNDQSGGPAPGGKAQGVDAEYEVVDE
jgi:hypothetical protein